MDDVPADLVTDTDTWEGELYNDAEIVKTSGTPALVNITGTVTSATYNVQLYCASGESFKDHASASTNALVYNASNGIGLRKTSNYNPVVLVNEQYTEITGVQIRHEGGTNTSSGLRINSSNCTARDCILETEGTSSEAANCVTLFVSNGGVTVVNCLLVQTGVGRGVHIQTGSANKFINCTVVTSNGSNTSTGMYQRYDQSHYAENCCSFGFSTDWNANWNEAGDTNNASDSTGSPGSNPQDSLTFADQFVAVDNTDWRLKSGSTLEGNGVQSTETSDLDIVGNARNTSTPDIGCWEYQAAASGAGTFLSRLQRPQVRHMLNR